MTKTYKISILENEMELLCQENERIMEAMWKNGKGPITHGCFGGGCGVCKMKIISGDYRTVKKMSRAHLSKEEEQEGVVLICCIIPTSDLVLTAQI